MSNLYRPVRQVRSNRGNRRHRQQTPRPSPRATWRRRRKTSGGTDPRTDAFPGV